MSFQYAHHLLIFLELHFWKKVKYITNGMFKCLFSKDIQYIETV